MAGQPRNLLSQKPYRGINVWMLASAGYACPYWLTYRQAQQISGQVRRGEHGLPIVFWKWRDQGLLSPPGRCCEYAGPLCLAPGPEP